MVQSNINEPGARLRIFSDLSSLARRNQNSEKRDRSFERQFCDDWASSTLLGLVVWSLACDESAPWTVAWIAVPGLQRGGSCRFALMAAQTRKYKRIYAPIGQLPIPDEVQGGDPSGSLSHPRRYIPLSAPFT